jgi:demethylmenaquinone methyltransferase/2-methoxy-6-polyprenyl-1,4-benzoquinol methylase
VIVHKPVFEATLDNMADPQPSDKADFGFQSVPRREKAGRVRAVFDSVAPKYDLMNDLMSGGLHRLWKIFTLHRTGLQPGQMALDVAGGTGDLAAGLAARVGPDGLVLMTDINGAMLEQGRRRLLDRGIFGNVVMAQANAENLPFAANQFHCITIGFGLRNVTNKSAALASMMRTLKPGGRLLILEFSKPALNFLKPVYDFYSFKILPALGKIVASDAQSYQYLAESIRMHPDQEAMLTLMSEAGLEDNHYYNLSGGIVALHVGYKY